MSPEMSDMGFHIESLRYRYPGADTPIFEDLNFSIAAGEFIALVGGSGVGKSTVLRNVAGLIAPSGGRVRAPVRRREARPTAFVFQDTRLLPWRRIRANVRYGLTGLGLTRAGKRERVDEVMDLTAIADLADRWPHEISGGQAQRANLARALAVRPRLLLMDEPFSAVDALTRSRLQEELLAIWRRLNMSVLFVTHDIREAVYLAQRVQVIRGTPARIVFDETVPGAGTTVRSDPELQAFTERVAGAL